MCPQIQEQQATFNRLLRYALGVCAIFEFDTVVKYRHQDQHAAEAAQSGGGGGGGGGAAHSGAVAHVFAIIA